MEFLIARNRKKRSMIQKGICRYIFQYYSSSFPLGWICDIICFDAVKGMEQQRRVISADSPLLPLFWQGWLRSRLCAFLITRMTKKTYNRVLMFTSQTRNLLFASVEKYVTAGSFALQQNSLVQFGFLTNLITLYRQNY